MVDKARTTLPNAKGGAPIVKVGHTAHRFYGTDPNLKGMVSKNDSRDLSAK